MHTYYFHTESYTVGYDGNPVLSDVRLEIRQGQIVALIGPNGAGKTTLLKSLIGQLAPIAGVAYLDGGSMARMQPEELARRMSVVLTQPLQTELMTVEAVVETGRYPYTGRFGRLEREDRIIVAKAMQTVHVMELREQDFQKLSDGQRQRVMLARALAQQPEILVLDEPTSFLDIRHKLEFLSILRELSRQQNLTVIISMHEVELAGKIADQVACFRDGYLDRFGNPAEVFAGDYIRKLYGIKLEELVPELRDLVMEPGEILRKDKENKKNINC